MRVSDRLAQGASLPRGSWRGVNPQTQVVPAKKGQKAPYRRQPRRKRDQLADTDRHDNQGRG